MVVHLEDVYVAHDHHTILMGVNFIIERGEFVSLVGESGAGKSSLLRLLYMDLKPDAGGVKVLNFDAETTAPKHIPRLRRKLGIVFQDFKLLEDRDVHENVAFALYVTNASRSDIKKRVLHALADVGLSHKRNQMPHELSGGELQRVVIARALVNAPSLLLADEPTGNLDPAASSEIMELLRKINMRGTGVLMATHNYDLVRKYPARVIQLKEGRLFDIEIK